ncbi:sperm acrosome membrane-associated protein 6 [Microcaecilia unicolor]|uniref:Sperm acrosome membrane-associated protein 6 n=1 Tax=Microcaecilia unicolor TaxID=1415580 RepID=A0A6P7YW74_9AMPH|nr:sperm acrosome membrane-associated protein 6 [Microcaecilia unicolor]
MIEAYRPLLSLLVVLLSSNGTRGCMLCFFTAEYRLRICRQFLQYVDDHLFECQNLFKEEFRPYSHLEIGAREKERVKRIFTKAMHNIERKSTRTTRNFTEDIPEEIRKIKPELESIPKAVFCVPPCGYQKNSRLYKCESCSVMDCGYPVDCKLQDIFVQENARTLIQCVFKFTIPKDITVVWKFAKNLKTQDLSYFKDLFSGEDLFILIKPTKPYHQGTYCCQIQDGPDILARNYFYVNVTAFSTAANAKLQELFYSVVDADEDVALLSQQTFSTSFYDLLLQPDFLRRTSVILIMVAIALFTMLFTLLVGMAYLYATDIEED